MSEHLLEVKGLKQHFPIKTGFLKTKMLKAVDGVSFTIDAGETMGWSASPAAARPRWAVRCCASTSPPRAA